MKSTTILFRAATRLIATLCLAVAILAVPSAAANRGVAVGAEKKVNNTYILSWDGQTYAKSADTLFILYKDTSSTASANVRYPSFSGLRSDLSNAPYEASGTVYLHFRATADADGSEIAIRGFKSLDGGATFDSVVVFLDTIPQNGKLSTKASMPITPNALFYWRITTTSATDSTAVKNIRIFR